MQKTIKVSINGTPFTITTDEHDQEIELAARLVDTMLKDKMSKHANLSSDRAALIVALTLATDAARQQKLLQQYEEKLQQLTASLEELALV